MRKHFVAVFGCLALLSLSIPAQTAPSLKDLLDNASLRIGVAPEKFPTAFLVVSVTPIAGGECGLQVVTYGMIYSLAANRDTGRCANLPSLHSLVWGRVWRSKLAASLRAGNIADVAADYVDLVYANGPKPKAATYMIVTAEAIGPDWGQ
ncbi:MAG: hypothetical protein ABR912_06745 [Terracidiphilus sp.]|jgi:hypothetical protein